MTQSAVLDAMVMSPTGGRAAAERSAPAKRRYFPRGAVFPHHFNKGGAQRPVDPGIGARQAHGD